MNFSHNEEADLCRGGGAREKCLGNYISKSGGFQRTLPLYFSRDAVPDGVHTEAFVAEVAVKNTMLRLAIGEPLAGEEKPGFGFLAQEKPADEAPSAGFGKTNETA